MNKHLQCFICEKELKSIMAMIPPCSLDGGSSISISTGYGSGYDQGLLFDPIVDENSEIVDGEIPLITKNTKWKKADWIARSDLANEILINILSCHKVRAFICDECLKKKESLLRGYNIVGTEPNGEDICEEFVFN